jgi:hypothetical protein
VASVVVVVRGSSVCVGGGVGLSVGSVGGGVGGGPGGASSA